MVTEGRGPDDELIEWLDRGDTDTATVVTSVRQPAALREAVKAAVALGMDATVNDATVQAVRDRVEAFAQRRALDAHYDRYPDVRPTLADQALAAAELDGNPLADDPALLRAAADEVLSVKPDAGPDDVLVYAAALRSRAVHGGPGRA